MIRGNLRLRVVFPRVGYLRHPAELFRLVILRALEPRSPPSLRASLQRTIDEVKMNVYHAEGVRRCRALLARTAKPYKVNIGCGAQRLDGWINIDLHPEADIRVDIRRPLPLPPGSCAAIVSEHVIEHLAYPGEVERVLADWYRLLIPGGLVSVGFPDTEDVLRSYVSGDMSYFRWCRSQGWNPPWNVTRLDQINFHFRQQSVAFGQDHLYAYDIETMSARLRSAGFVAIEPRPFDPATDTRPETRYVRARKPTARENGPPADTVLT